MTGSTTPPSRSPGLNGSLTNGHPGPTAAQVLQAPPPARRDSGKESIARSESPESVSTCLICSMSTHGLSFRNRNLSLSIFQEHLMIPWPKSFPFLSQLLPPQVLTQGRRWQSLAKSISRFHYSRRIFVFSHIFILLVCICLAGCPF